MIIKIVQKEFNLFLSRKAMVKWYIVLILMNIFAAFLPIIPDIGILKNHAITAIVYMSFTVLLVPNNLSLDVVGGERVNGTLETLLSSPISSKDIFIGKSLHILILTSVAATCIAILDNLLLFFCYGITFFDSGLSTASLVALCLMLIASAMTEAFLGTVLSLKIKNLKLVGYIVALVEIVCVIYIYKVILQEDLKTAYVYIVALFSICMYVYFGIVRQLKKFHIMKVMK